MNFITNEQSNDQFVIAMFCLQRFSNLWRIFWVYYLKKKQFFQGRSFPFKGTLIKLSLPKVNNFEKILNLNDK